MCLSHFFVHEFGSARYSVDYTCPFTEEDIAVLMLSADVHVESCYEGFFASCCGVAHVHDHSLLSVPLCRYSAIWLITLMLAASPLWASKRFRYAEVLFQSTSHGYRCAFTVETLPYRCCPQQTSLGELNYDYCFHTVSHGVALTGQRDWLRGGRVMARACVNDPSQLPVDVSVRFSHLFDLEATLTSTLWSTCK